MRAEEAQPPGTYPHNCDVLFLTGKGGGGGTYPPKHAKPKKNIF